MIFALAQINVEFETIDNSAGRDIILLGARKGKSTGARVFGIDDVGSVYTSHCHYLAFTCS